jgi:predicted DCC family thiol-disulfide oxidoreductase YuxK
MTLPNRKIIVYYDGTCRLCSGIVEKLEQSSQSEKFESVDAAHDELPTSISKKAAMRDVHVVDERGRVYAGADAVLHIIDEYPRWRWVSSIVKLPGMRQLAALGYRVVADNRHRFLHK